MVWWRNYDNTIADPRGEAHPAPPYFRKGKEFLKYLSFANSEGGPKRLKSDSCEAESCFPGYRIIETTANGSGLCEAIAHQLVAGTYNVPASSHIIRSVLVSYMYVCENPAMTAEVTPEGLCNHNEQGLVWTIEHSVRLGSGSPPREGASQWGGGGVSHCKVQVVST